MNGIDFLPSREAELLAWSVNFGRLINESPELYGLRAEQAAEYAALHEAYAEALQRASDPGTRTPSSVVTKREAKAALKAAARALARVARAHPGTTDVMRCELGLTVPDAEPTPTGAPTHAPGIDVVSARLWTVRLRLHDSRGSLRRGKPWGVQGALVFSAVGALPPASDELNAWTFERLATRPTVEVAFASTVESGAAVWFTACWFNARGERGPMTPPVGTRIPGTIMRAA